MREEGASASRGIGWCLEIGGVWDLEQDLWGSGREAYFSLRESNRYRKMGTC